MTLRGTAYLGQAGCTQSINLTLMVFNLCRIRGSGARREYFVLGIECNKAERAHLRWQASLTCGRSRVYG